MWFCLIQSNKQQKAFIDAILIMVMPRAHRILAPFAIFWVPVLYGGYYVATIIAMTEISVFWLNSFRMFIALLLFLPFMGKLKTMKIQDLWVNLALGGCFLGGLIAQSYGLKTVTAGTSGFLAALFILFTPILRWLLFKKQMSPWYLLPILISGVGYYWMFRPEEGGTFHLGIGEWLSIIGAFTIALHMVIMERYVGDRDPFVFSILQTTVIFLGCFVLALIFDFSTFSVSLSPRVWCFVIYLGIGATILPFLLQSYGQKYVNAVLASLIIALEPLFATLFGVLFGGETVSSHFIVGGILIFCGAFGAIFIQGRSGASEEKLPPTIEIS